MMSEARGQEPQEPIVLQQEGFAIRKRNRTPPHVRWANGDAAAEEVGAIEHKSLM